MSDKSTEQEVAFAPLPPQRLPSPPPHHHLEAYLQLLKDRNKVLGEDWDHRTQIETKEKFNAAMADSLRIWI